MTRSPKKTLEVKTVPARRKDKQCYEIGPNFYIHDKTVDGGNKIYIRCRHFKNKPPCNARGILRNGVFEANRKAHTCSDNETTQRIHHLKHKMKLDSEDLGRNLKAIYDLNLEGEPSSVSSQLPYVSVRPSMYDSRRRKYPAIKGVENIIEYYEEGGRADDKFAKKCYLGYVLHTEENEGTII